MIVDTADQRELGAHAAGRSAQRRRSCRRCRRPTHGGRGDHGRGSGAPRRARHRARRPLHPHPPGAARVPAPPRRRSSTRCSRRTSGEESLFGRGQGRAGHRRLARHRPDDRARLRRERRHGLHLVAQARGVRRGRRRAVARSAPATRCPPTSASEAECNRLAAELAKREPKLHILVNNAGANWGAPLAEYPDDAWDKVLALNLKSIFHLTRACLPQLEAAATPDDPARVINIGSIDGLRVPLLDTYAYSSSKAAVHHLTRVLAVELAAKHITVNAVAPGPFESKMMAETLRTLRRRDQGELPARPHRRAGGHGRRRDLSRLARRRLPDRDGDPGRRRDHGAGRADRDEHDAGANATGDSCSSCDLGAVDQSSSIDIAWRGQRRTASSTLARSSRPGARP